jgi:hypothetical protein
MGMTIDKAICQVKGYRNIQKYQEDYAWSYPLISSIDTLLEVADKYQQIEQIVEPLKQLEIDEMSSIEWNILKVVEDGKTE